MAPAIRHAANGFGASEYLCAIINSSSSLIERFPATAAVFMPSGSAPAAGDLIIQPDLAGSYATIAEQGPDALYGGVLGEAMASYMAAEGGLITLDDLTSYTIEERYKGPVEDCPTVGTYRGFQIVGCTPCSAGGVHLVEMLNILEHFDVAGLGFGERFPSIVHLYSAFPLLYSVFSPIVLHLYSSFPLLDSVFSPIGKVPRRACTS